MNMLGFTGQASLYRTTGHYGGGAGLADAVGSGIVPAQATCNAPCFASTLLNCPDHCVQWCFTAGSLPVLKCCGQCNPPPSSEPCCKKVCCRANCE